MNITQLQKSSLALYFAVAIPLLAFIIFLLILVKAAILYRQSGEKRLNFFSWVLAGRPQKQRLPKPDLEQGIIIEKLRDRLRGTNQAPKSDLQSKKGKAKGSNKGKKRQ